MGLCVVALYALGNRGLGASGAYRETLGAILRRPTVEVWRVWNFVGLCAGALAVAFLRGGPQLQLGYSSLSGLLPVALLAVVLLAAGILMGFGARWAGGCTSSHGLRGTAELSPASIAATLTFFATAVILANVLHMATGGGL